ncbi:hypothetical protein CMK11_01745, partial [Candidatus Poribacteria bacterium]|nr:hypothetical protein [Candidatus Poribacteria bacterium]
MRVSYICIGLATALLGAATAAGQNVGPRIAYASNADGDYEIYTIQSDGTDPIQLTSNGDTDTAPAWSPDRTRIAFHSDRFGDGNIWIMDAEDADGDGNGDNLVQLTTDTAPDEEPRISPDGARIMFQSRRDTPGSYELYAMDIDGSNVVRLTTSAVADTSGGWSPDSSRIVWSAGNNIWVMDAIDGDGDGNGDNAELWLGGHVGAPRWSFDGSTLVYSNYDGDWDIYLMGPGGANVRPLTAGPADEWGDFSPNGRHVVYADNQGGSGAHNLYVIPTDGSAAATQITSDGTASPSVAWAPYVPRVAVGDATGPPGGSVVVPVTVTELRGWDVVGMALELVFDPAILTPSATDAVLLGDAFVDAAEWYVEYGETTPGILTIALAGVAASGPVDAGVLATVQFDVSASAGVGTQTPLALAVADLNEGSVPRALVDGSYSFFVMYGDVTGNGAVRPYDAGWILEFVASRLIDETIPLPIEYETPAWSTDHVPQDVAWEVADVYKGDDPATVPPDTITAMDAVTILQHVVGAVPDLPFSPPASAPAMLATTHRLVGSSASARPGTEIVVSLSAEGLHAGELRLDFDPRVLRLKGVSAGSAASTG